MAEAGKDLDNLPFDEVGGERIPYIKTKEGRKQYLRAKGGAPFDTWPFKNVLTEIGNFRSRHPGASDDDIEATEPAFKDLKSRREALIEKAKDLKLLEYIDQETITSTKALRQYGSKAGAHEIRTAMKAARDDCPPEPAELEGVCDYYLEDKIEYLKSIIERSGKMETPVTAKDIPSILDEQISEWERLREFPPANEEERIRKALAELPQAEILQYHGKDITIDKLQEYFRARLNFLRLWCLSNNEEGGGDPKEMAKIFYGWHDEWFPLLFKYSGEGDKKASGAFVYYLERYRKEDQRLQNFINGLNRKYGENLSKEKKEAYDDEICEFFKFMTIGAKPEMLRIIRKKALGKELTLQEQDKIGSSNVDISGLIADEAELLRKYHGENGGPFDELTERIGFEFAHMNFSSYFDRGVELNVARKEIFGDKTYFTKKLFGNSPYSNRFIDHLEAFMASESRGRPLINKYFADLVHIIKSERIERELLKGFGDGIRERFDKNLTDKENPGIDFDFFDLGKDKDSKENTWEGLLQNPENAGMGTFFTVYDDREKTVAMRAAVQDFLQGPDERTFLEVLKNFRSTRSGIRDVFVKDFTRQFIDFMRHENKALFDLPNWDTAKTEKFIEGLKGAHLIHEKDANAILREKLGINVNPVNSLAWAVYTPLEKMFPNSPITKAVEKFTHSDLAKAMEKFHLPGWWWARGIRKLGNWKTYTGATWATISKFVAELSKMMQRDISGGGR